MSRKQEPDRAPERLFTFENWFERANVRSRGILGAVRQVISRFNDARGPQAAGSLAFFALLSLIPFALLLITVAGYLAESDLVYATMQRLIEELFPARHDVVLSFIDESRGMEVRGIAGAVGFFGAAWAASGWFNVLAYNINIAWPNMVLRSAVHRRLFSLGMVAVLVILLFLSLVTTIIGEVLPAVSLPFRVRFAVLFTDLWRLLLGLLPWALTFLMFLGIYRWVPNRRVRWRAALAGAAFATLTWELGKILFAWYISSGLVNLDLVFGSLGTTVVLLLWIYLSGLIALFGAHLTALIDLRG